jgi:hypothetical protein
MTKGYAELFKESCMVCMSKHGHTSGVELQTLYEKRSVVHQVRWTGSVTEQLILAHGSQTDFVEEAACAIALLFVREMTDYTTISKSRGGTTIDYYLRLKAADPTLVFNQSTRLEVSGIFQETSQNSIDRRIKDKKDRLKQNQGESTYIFVAAFNHPAAKLVIV